MVEVGIVELVGVVGTVTGGLVVVDGFEGVTRRLNKLMCGSGTKNTAKITAATRTRPAKRTLGARRKRVRCEYQLQILVGRASITSRASKDQ